jgi:hypothetical protein
MSLMASGWRIESSLGPIDCQKLIRDPGLVTLLILTKSPYLL